ncbi:MAG: putative diguanylate cyclase YedQ [Syntrophomonadaceae bacterium]|nr:putative diguanylate cyclase YedQ [Bacillota bacterium]
MTSAAWPKLINCLPLPAFILQDGIIREVNSELVRLTGYPAAELTGMSIAKLICQDYLPGLTEDRRISFEGEDTPPEMDLQIIDRQGDSFSVRSYCHNIDISGCPAALFLLVDVTVQNTTIEKLMATERDLRQQLKELHKNEQVLRESEYKFRQLFHNSNDGILLVEVINNRILGRFKEVNDIVCKRLGYTREEFFTLKAVDLAAPEYVAQIPELQNDLLTKRRITFETVCLTKKGQRIPFEISGYIFVLHGETVVLLMARDITERKLAEAQLKYLSMHDSLTGLYNRFYFDEEMRRLESGRNRPFAIIVCDIDGLKLVNDTMGHQSGDNLLAAASNVIKESFRCEDVIARVGGDEYAIILPNSDLTAANFACSRLRAAVDMYNENNPSLPLSISMGCAASSDGKVNVTELFKEADDKMYKEKLHRKKQIRQFSPKGTKRRRSAESLEL